MRYPKITEFYGTLKVSSEKRQESNFALRLFKFYLEKIMIEMQLVTPISYKGPKIVRFICNELRLFKNCSIHSHVTG